MAQKARLTGEAGRRCLLRKITKRYQYTLGKQACQEGSGGEMISGIYFFSKQWYNAKMKSKGGTFFCVNFLKN